MSPRNSSPWREGLRQADGLLLVLFSSAWFAAATLLVKHLGAEMPVAWVAFMRSATALPIVAVFMRRRGLSFKSRRPFILLLRGIWGIAAMITLFWALPRIPIANVMLMSHASPLYAAIWGVLFLDEKLDNAARASLAVAFAGVYLALRPDLAMDSLPYFAALASGVLSSLAFVTIRSLAATEPALRIIFYFGLVGAVVFFPFVLTSGYLPSAREWALMLAVGLTATVGQVFLTTGITKAPVSRASIGAAFIIVLNIAGGWLWWGEVPDGLTWLGCLFIVGGIFGLTTAVRRRLLVTVAE